MKTSNITLYHVTTQMHDEKLKKREKGEKKRSILSEYLNNKL